MGRFSYRACWSCVCVVLLAMGCPGAIVDYPEQREMEQEEILNALRGDDFREKNAARKQLGTLSPDVQMDVLERLLQELDAPTRMIAVSELAARPSDQSTALLRQVADSDPDDEVRELALLALGEDPPEPDDEGDDGQDPEAPNQDTEAEH